jgi:hypothetical protein
MKKSAVIFTIVLILFILLGLFLYDYYRPANKCNRAINEAIKQKNYTLCGYSEMISIFKTEKLLENTRYNCYESCMLSFKKKINDINVCNNIPNKYYRLDCYVLFSDQVKNITETCNTFKDNETKDICLSTFIPDKNDVSLCYEITNYLHYRDMCISKIANIRNDSSICELVQEIKQRDVCYGVIAGNKKDSSICYQIEDQEKRETCINFI